MFKKELFKRNYDCLNQEDKYSLIEEIDNLETLFDKDVDTVKGICKVGVNLVTSDISYVDDNCDKIIRLHREALEVFEKEINGEKGYGLKHIICLQSHIYSHLGTLYKLQFRHIGKIGIAHEWCKAEKKAANLSEPHDPKFSADCSSCVGEAYWTLYKGIKSLDNTIYIRGTGQKKYISKSIKGYQKFIDFYHKNTTKDSGTLMVIKIANRRIKRLEGVLGHKS